jgi:hypothetical protein
VTSVLIDTSVWVDHFRHRNPALARLLSRDAALMHPMVLGELACGTPPGPRGVTLRNLGMLRAAQQPAISEVIYFIERERLYGLGCGLVDITVLASTLITPETRLWTVDHRLHALAQRFRVSYVPP